MARIAERYTVSAPTHPGFGTSGDARQSWFYGAGRAMEHTFSGRLSWEDGLGGEAIVIMVRSSRGGKMEYDAGPGRVGSIDVTST